MLGVRWHVGGVIIVDSEFGLGVTWLFVEEGYVVELGLDYRVQTSTPGGCAMLLFWGCALRWCRGGG